MSDSIFANVVSCRTHAGQWQYFMSDAIVVWRAWVLWEGNVSVRVLLSLCLFGTFGNSRFTRIPPMLRASTVGLTIDMTFGALWLFGNNKFTPTGPRTLVMVLPLVFTNVVATASIGVKAWCVSDHCYACLLYVVLGTTESKSRSFWVCQKTRKQTSSGSSSSSRNRERFIVFFG